VDEEYSNDDIQPSIVSSSVKKKRPPRDFDEQTQDNLVATAKKKSLAVVNVGNGAHKVYDSKDPNGKVIILDDATLRQVFPNADISDVRAGLKCASGDECPLGPGAEIFFKCPPWSG